MCVRTHTPLVSRKYPVFERTRTLSFSCKKKLKEKLTWFIILFITEILQFLNNVVINKTKLPLH